MPNLSHDRETQESIRKPLRQLAVGLAAILMVGLYIFWRADSERMEILRAEIVDRLIPGFEIGIKPGRFIADMVRAAGELSRSGDRIEELEGELQSLLHWKERAQRLEQQNAQLRQLANLKLSPARSLISAEVLADTSFAFRHSILINVGRQDRVEDGWAVMDDLGLVGRISGVSRSTSRVILLTDSNSRVPIKVKPSNARGIATGNNGPSPHIELAGDAESINPGDRVLTSGEGGVFPPDLLVGTIAPDAGGLWRTPPPANHADLEFVKVVKGDTPESVEPIGNLLLPEETSDTADGSGG